MSLEQTLALTIGKITDQLNAIAGAGGGKYIAAADGTVNVNSVGFTSWDDATVISHLIVGGADIFESTYNLGTITIPKGMTVTWGNTATSITLSAGAGWLIKK